MSEEHLKSELQRFKDENKRLVAKCNEQADHIAELEHAMRVLEREMAEVKEEEIRAEIQEALQRRGRLRQT